MVTVMNTQVAVAAATVVAAVGVAACGSSGGSTATHTVTISATSPATSTPATSTSVAASSAASSTSKASGTLAYGDTYKDTAAAVDVTLSRLSPFTPSRAAAVTPLPGNQYRKFTVTLHNVGSKPFDVGSFLFQATAGTKQATSVQDISANVGDPTATILPGRSLIYVEAFPVQIGQPLTVRVSSMATFDAPTPTWDGVVH